MITIKTEFNEGDPAIAWYLDDNLGEIVYNLAAFGRKNVSFNRVLRLLDALFLQEFICIEAVKQGFYHDSWCQSCPVLKTTLKMEMMKE